MNLPMRQIHLDFHTHESIQDIGADFDPERFADTLAAARVDSINLFARCHHGWLYYRSTAHPERVHPHLTRDLLAEQVAACHARGIRTPIYVTCRLDAQSSEEHPEWCCRQPNGNHYGFGPYDPGFYTNLCLNSPYVDFLETHVDDIFGHVPVDGLWFDIVMHRDCSCLHCRRGMLAEGRDPSVQSERVAYGHRVLDRFKQRMAACARAHDPEVPVFFNAGHVGPAIRDSLDHYSHLELESLPFGWGYHHFPTTVRYARTLGKPYLGMTGKFHTVWGDFHSFKQPAALTYECFTMLAHGAGCSIGDQLHPRGGICPHTYRLIGDVYREVERREEWCLAAKAMTEAAVFSPEEAAGSTTHRSLPRSIIGAVQLLQELHIQFDVVDSSTDLGPYRLLVLPDDIPVDSQLAAKIADFVAAGGAVLASAASGLDPSGSGFALDLGVRLVGDDPYQVPFVRPRPGSGIDLPETEHATTHADPHDHERHGRRVQVEAEADAEVLADMVAPYFNRTWRHYCSHRHAPSTGEVYAPAVVVRDRTAYIAQPLFTLFGELAPGWTKEVVAGILHRLLPDPMVRVIGAPPWLVATVTRQHDRGRVLVHLLNYVPRRNNVSCEIVDEPIPLHDVELELRIPEPIASVRLVPEDRDLSHAQRASAVTVTVPELHGYQIVEFTLASDKA